MPTADGRLPNADDRCRWRTPLAACPAIIGFLERTWKRELDCRLIKEIWTYGSNRIPVRFSVGVR